MDDKIVVIVVIGENIKLLRKQEKWLSVYLYDGGLLEMLIVAF